MFIVDNVSFVPISTIISAAGQSETSTVIILCGDQKFERTAMVVAFKCFLRKRCGFACNSQTHFPSHAEQLKRHLLSVSKGGCYGKSSEEAKIPLN